MTIRIVKIPIYGGKLRIDIVDDPRESKLWKERFACNKPSCNENKQPPRTRFAGLTFGYKSGMCIMLRRKCNNKKCNDSNCGGLNPNTVAHESYHAAMGILCNKGVKPDAKNQEPFAYMIGWIVDEINTTIDLDKKRNS